MIRSIKFHIKNYKIIFLNRTNLHNFLIKIFPVDNGSIFDLCLVGIDRIDGIVQEFGNFIVIGNTKPDQCKNSQITCKQLPFIGDDLIFIFEKLVEFSYEIGEYL